MSGMGMGSFHTGTSDGWLFSSWIPQSDGAYAGVWISIFLLAIIHRIGFRALCKKFITKRSKALHGSVVVVSVPHHEKRQSQEIQVYESDAEASSDGSRGKNETTMLRTDGARASFASSSDTVTQECNAVLPFRASVDIPRALIAFFESIIGYLL